MFFIIKVKKYDLITINKNKYKVKTLNRIKFKFSDKSIKI